MPQTATQSNSPIAQLDRDGLAEYCAGEFDFREGQGVVEQLAGDGMRRERETLRQHWMRCEGCEICWPESVQREGDI